MKPKPMRSDNGFSKGQLIYQQTRGYLKFGLGFSGKLEMAPFHATDLPTCIHTHTKRGKSPGCLPGYLAGLTALFTRHVTLTSDMLNREREI